VTDVAGVVISGGSSERLGRDKAREVVGGVSLLERVLGAVGEVVEHLLVVGPWAPDGVPRSEESPRHEGPLRAFAHAARTAGVSHLLLVGCDHPFLQPALLAHIVSRRDESEVVAVSGTSGPEPLLAVYSVAVLPVAERLLESGARSLKRLLDEVVVRHVAEEEWRRYDPDGLSLIDVDDEDSLERARRLT
jgi:molybdopterin-guanine dinucleotide biosynthesis protein A